MTVPRAHRPGSVTLVVVLTWISALLSSLWGLIILLLSPATGSLAYGRAYFVVGVVLLVFGLITAAVASRLGKGGNGARMLVSALQVLQIAGAIAGIATAGGTSTVGQSVLTIVLAFAILGLLWNSRANAFFAAAPQDRTTQR
ncbi:MAG: hypothetical protein J0I34_22695 [Pseudonocardia sp.]|uniref:hypothetical protein n=1 Tax=unclassified Pseudonocardia TaxID=2619320 RepID=UPI000AF7A365|nr:MULTISPECIES: hypothetical protein [unclassified Pseudonocardia]MBN9111579.1 hypothetical protein [Pseudonocardia sp.]